MQRMLSVVSNGLCVVAFLALVGCYSYRPLPIRVEDEATGKPLQGAHVRAGYKVYLNPFPPKTSEGYTDNEGRVTLSFTPDAGGAPFVEATMPGYLPSESRKIKRDDREVSTSSHDLPALLIPLQKEPKVNNE